MRMVNNKGQIPWNKGLKGYNSNYPRSKRVKLHPHHIKPLATNPELVFDVNNGITYCKEFHMSFHGLLKLEAKI
jgi:hypothetical protein